MPRSQKLRQLRPTPANNEMPTRQRSRLWTNRLWVLSGLLGAATLASTAAIIHDSSRQISAGRLLARSAAQQAATIAAGRLQILALETFAPVAPWETTRANPAKVDLDALAGSQRDAVRCRCRDTLPVEAFFRFEVQSGELELERIDTTAMISTEEIKKIARAESERPRSSRTATHLVAMPSGDRATVTIVRASQNGEASVIYGLAAGARAIAQTVFEGVMKPRAATSQTAPFNPLDSLVFEVRTPALSNALVGAVSPTNRFRATVYPSGSLEGLGITAALTRPQAVHSLFVSQQAIWHLGLMLLATIFVIVFAIGSSRRDLLLARARSDFIAGVSHDLRMPLAQILIASETLTMKRERDEAERDKLSSSIVREARRLVSIVDNVLLFSRSGAVALRPRLEPLAASALFNDVADSVSLAVEDAGQTLDVDDSGSVVLLGDRQLLRQALVNLVDNALKYGSPGQRIRLGATRESSSAVRLYVEDEGPGVPKEERTRILEPYERLSRDQVSERTGTGLGLSVVRHIADVCGGRVWLEDGTAGGTRAVLELPGGVASESPAPHGQLV